MYHGIWAKDITRWYNTSIILEYWSIDDNGISIDDNGIFIDHNGDIMDDLPIEICFTYDKHDVSWLIDDTQWNINRW